MPPALAVRGLEKRYGRIDALRGVDLDVADGELVGLLGPNGAGKSTLLRTIYGYLHPTAGDVFHDGRSIKGLAPEPRAG